ncbi:MAG: ABC transporter ATP-binding protein [Candidatus Kryptoniota bacterium]
MNDATLLQIKHLKKYFEYKPSALTKPKTLKAVDDVSFSLEAGETIGIVGESGCGKTTTGYTIARLYQPTSGEILFKGQDIASLDESSLFNVRRKLQIIFQDPFASLNPRMTVAEIIAEPFEIFNVFKGSKTQVFQEVLRLLELVGLKKEFAGRYPHEFSGGQRQRIGIARAIALNPELIVCDEPISALDVSIQAQIVNLLQDLQEKLRLSYIFISHNISMVKYISDRICVMYLGRVAELSESFELYRNPLHPYTSALLSAIPVADPDLAETRKRIIIEGSVPSPIDPPPGCRFKQRCPRKMAICDKEDPQLREVAPHHYVACHLYS